MTKYNFVYYTDLPEALQVAHNAACEWMLSNVKEINSITSPGCFEYMSKQVPDAKVAQGLLDIAKWMRDNDVNYIYNVGT